MNNNPVRRGLKSPPHSENPLKRVPEWASAHFRYEPRTLVLGGSGFGKRIPKNLGFPPPNRRQSR